MMGIRRDANSEMQSDTGCSVTQGLVILACHVQGAEDGRKKDQLNNNVHEILRFITRSCTSDMHRFFLVGTAGFYEHAVSSVQNILFTNVRDNGGFHG